MEAVMETIVPAEAQVKIDESRALASTYEHYAITTAENYLLSAEDLKVIKTKKNELDTTRKSLTDPLETTKKRIIALFKPPLDFLTQAEATVKRAMIAWQTEQERIRRAEEARLAKIQQEEAEKLRKQAEKEAARIDNLKTDAAKERAIAKAEELQAQAESVVAIAPVVETKVEEISGISTRKIWKFEITDPILIPREYLIPDEKYIGDIVRASKGKKEISGVRIYAENIISART